MMNEIVIVIYLYLISLEINAEVYSSLYKMESLIETQREVINTLDNFMNNAKHKNNMITNYFHRFKEEHQTAIGDIATYLENPINSFRIIKRLTVDVDLIQTSLNKSFLFKDLSVRFPTQEDLDGAAEGLLRLESIYKLQKEHLANGILNTSHGKNEKSYEEQFNPMTISDCYELGKALFRHQYYSHGIDWLKEARKKKVDASREYPEDDAITLEDIDDQIDNGQKSNDNLFKNFTEWNTAISIQMPNVTTMSPNVIIEVFKNGLNPLEATEAIKTQQSDIISLDKSKEIPYDDLCRGKNGKENYTKHLKCYMEHGPHPYLKFAPVKAELMNFAPLITLFHDVISDAEIKVLQDLAKQSLERPRVISRHKYDYSNNRICQVGYARSNESIRAARVRMRVMQLTGLDLTNSEQLQIANYGIGGHFSTHYDYLSNNSFIAEVGNRIGTFLFYMTDVKLGGATVFPRLGLVVYPVKGAALFWNNLLPSGLGNPYTCHAACPVLLGSKWVATQWINLRGQELNRPCPLNSKS